MPETYYSIPELPELKLTQDLRLINIVPEGLIEAETSLLDSIVEACGLSANTQSIRMVVASPQLLAAALRQNKDRDLYVVSYGIAPQDLGLRWTVESYQWYTDGRLHYCFADRPSQIGSNVALKKQLWHCLKALKSS